MDQILENRRDFLKRAGFLAAALPLIVGCKNEIIAQNDDILSLIKKNAVQHDGEWNGAKDAPQNVTWQADLANRSDKGERIKIYGTVYHSDGKTPAPNVLIYFYHTDIDGLYAKNRNEHRHGRFRSWVLTNESGKYEINSIKPAPYPSRTEPAHIHFTLTGTNFKEDWIDSVWFAGDEFITPEITRKQMLGKGGFQPIIKLEKDANGYLTGKRDLQLWKV